MVTKQLNLFRFHCAFGYPVVNILVKMGIHESRYLNYLDRLRMENSYLASWAYKKGRR